MILRCNFIYSIEQNNWRSKMKDRREEGKLSHILSGVKNSDKLLKRRGRIRYGIWGGEES